MSSLYKYLFSFFFILLLTCGNAQQYRFDRKIGLPLKDGEFNSPQDVAIDAEGRFFVADTYNNRIQVFNSTGAFLFKFGELGEGNGQFLSPGVITIGNDGNIYVGELDNYRVQVFTSTGDFIRKFGSEGTGNGQFARIKDIALAGNGNIYVADRNRIQIFNSTGQYISQFGGLGSGNGQFSEAAGIAIDGANQVYVVDRGNSRIQIFNTSGTFIRKFSSYGTGDGQLIYPAGIVIGNSGAIYVCDNGNTRIQKFASTDVFQSKFSSWGANSITTDKNENLVFTKWDTNQVKMIDTSGALVLEFGFHEVVDGKFSSPTSITLDQNNNIYVVDTDNYRVQIFNNDGTFYKTIGTYGSGDGKFYLPRAIKINNQSQIYVVDNAKSEIQIFDGDGTFIKRFGSYGSTNGKFNSPTGIAFHPNGNLYVVDKGNNNIQVLSSEGTFLKKFGSEGSGEGQFNGPIDIAIDKSGTVYIMDTDNHRVQVLDENGQFIREIKSINGEALYPISVAVDNDGLLYIGDYAKGRVLIFNSNGDLINQFSFSGQISGQINAPTGIAVDSNKIIYAVDYFNSIVQIYVPQSDPTITFNDIETSYGATAFDLNATTNSTGAISYQVINENPGEVTLSGTGNRTVTIIKSGTVKIKAFVESNGSYAATSKEMTLTIRKATLQATVSAAVRSFGEVNPTFTIQYSGFQYSENKDVIDVLPVVTTSATANSNTGSYSLVLSGGADINYGFNYANGALTINKANQLITFAGLTDQVINGTPVTLNATSSSGLPVTLIITEGSTLASLSDNVLNPLSQPGKITIEANQSGNINYNAAAPKSQSFNIITDPVAGIGEELNTRIYIGPNPATENIIINSKDNAIDRIILYDYSGKTILTEYIQDKKNYILRVNHLTKGIYLLAVQIDGKNQNTRIAIK